MHDPVTLLPLPIGPDEQQEYINREYGRQRIVAMEAARKVVYQMVDTGIISWRHAYDPEFIEAILKMVDDAYYIGSCVGVDVTRVCMISGRYHPN